MCKLIIVGPITRVRRAGQNRLLWVEFYPDDYGFEFEFFEHFPSFPYPELKNNDVYANLYNGLNTTIDFAKRVIRWNMGRYDYAYIHFKETDVPGHDGKPKEKKRMVEMLDTGFFSFIKELNQREKVKIVITGDHSTVCSVKAHTSDALPFLVVGGGKDETSRFNESEAKKGEIGKIYGKDVMQFIL